MGTEKIEDAKKLQAGTLNPNDIPDEDRDFYLERRYPAFGNLVPRDVASRAAKERCDAGFGVNNTGKAVFLDFKYAIAQLGRDTIEKRYGNLFQMYEKNHRCGSLQQSDDDLSGYPLFYGRTLGRLQLDDYDSRIVRYRANVTSRITGQTV